MPELINCRKCGKMFTYNAIGPKVCNKCKADEENEFKVIKEYLYENPGATITEVSHALNITTVTLRRYLKEGRLEIVSTGGEANMLLDCEKCGKSIRTGRYCDECERELSRGLSSVSKALKDTISAKSHEKARPSVGEGMRFMNKEK